MKLDRNTKTKALLAKAICYGFEMSRFRHETKSDDKSLNKERAYAARYAHSEYADFIKEVDGFLECIDVVNPPLG